MATPVCREINPQSASPLFNRIPNEIRNHIFELALTSFDDKTRPYKKGAYYYRPGYRYAQKIDTTLLLTCRRIFLETESVPASINEHTSWYERPPADVANNELSMKSHPSAFKRRLRLKTLHLFTQQYWLEGQRQRGVWRFGFQTLTQNWDSMFASVTCLKITLRHSDWWWWEHEAPIGLEPKRSGRASACNHQARPSDLFQAHSWGAQFRNIDGLKTFQLELETVEKKRPELDAIVARAPGWQFPLGDGNLLILDQSKTRRTGWVGHLFGFVETEREFDDLHVPQSGNGADQHDAVDAGQDGAPDKDSVELTEDRPADVSTSKTPIKPSSAKQRLVADGVKFIEEDLEPRLPEDKLQTYYVITLTWCAHKGFRG